MKATISVAAGGLGMLILPGVTVEVRRGRVVLEGSRVAYSSPGAAYTLRRPAPWWRLWDRREVCEVRP